MRNTTITEEHGLWVVTLEQPSQRPQRYYCDNARLARRWAQLLGGAVRELTTRAQPAA